MATRRAVRLLIGTGLLLVGLLAGIWSTLLFDRDPAPRPSTRIVKSVDEGRGSSTVVDSGREDSPTPASLGDRFRRVAGQVRGAVVAIRVQGDEAESGPREFFDRPPRQQNLGSGVLISPDGYIVTNYHVIEGAAATEVRLPDKRQFKARIVGTDEATDLAVLKIDGPSDFPVLPIGRSDDVQVGDWVVAVGNPFRLTSTVTAGIVSALGRQLQIIEDQFRVENFIQTDAAINPGNSGGALVNLDGELIGINTAIASRTGAYEGYGFAIPSRLMERVVTDLMEHGEMRRGYLGVSIQEVDEDRAEEVGLDAIHGVYIAGVRSGSAADRAGIRRGDIVEAVAGQRVDAPNELQSVVALRRPGDRVQVRVWREGKTQTLTVRLMGEDTPAYQDWLSDRQSPPEPEPSPQAQRPQPPSDSTAETVVPIEPWGVGLRPLRAPEQERYEVDDGAYVAHVDQGRPAAEAGLPRDVVITALNDTSVATPTDVQTHLQDAETPVLVEVRRPDGTRAFYEIQ